MSRRNTSLVEDRPWKEEASRKSWPEKTAKGKADLTFPEGGVRLLEHASIRAWATTDRLELTSGDLLMSKRNSGFFSKFTQTRRTKLERESK